MAIDPKCIKPRRKCAATTREAILAAAHGRFLGESYDSVGLRDVARDAGVDVALVSRYFGTKEELFRQVLRGGAEPKFALPPDRDSLPDFFLSLLANGQDCERQHQRDKLLIMLRSASSPTAAEVIQTSFRRDVLDPLAAIIGGPDADCRAALAMSVLIGSNFLNTVLPVKPLTGDEQGEMRDRLLRLLRTALDPHEAQAPA